jgi:hypothetical protein
MTREKLVGRRMATNLTIISDLYTAHGAHPTGAERAQPGRVSVKMRTLIGLHAVYPRYRVEEMPCWVSKFEVAIIPHHSVVRPHCGVGDP